MTINTTEDSAIRQAAAALMPQLKDDLMQLARTPSVATAGFPAEPLFQAHDLVVDLQRGCGIEQIDRLEIEGKMAPVIVATVPGPNAAPTVTQTFTVPTNGCCSTNLRRPSSPKRFSSESSLPGGDRTYDERQRQGRSGG